MKKIFPSIIAMLFSISAIAQTPYTSFKDDKQVTILNGIITKYLLQNDQSFNWYNSSAAGYTVDKLVLNAIEESKGKLQYIVFGGTWCEDTQFILPKFFKLLEQAGVPDNQVSFFGVDRQKKTLGNLASAFNIINVPTIIVMKDGKETGRIVEYGKTGKWDIELADLVK